MSKSLARIKAIFFDLDQTLVDWRGYKESAIIASASAMRKAGLGLSEQEIRKMIENIYDEKGWEYQRVFDDLLLKLNLNPESKTYNKIKAAATVAYREAKRRYLRVYPDVPFALEELNKMGYTLGLISDAPQFQGWTRMYELNLVDYFKEDHIYIRKGIKNSSKIFEDIKKEHGYASDEMLMVGDNPQKDIKPANEAGILTVLIKYGQVYPIDSQDPLQYPDYHLRSIWELIGLLRKSKE
ncbi:MAG: HAD-IA family hydrolase [Candidatus Aenigmatarchaeota archaeon]